MMLLRRFPRIRKVVMWGGAAVTVLLVATSVGSRWWTFEAWTGTPGGTIINSLGIDRIGLWIGEHDIRVGWVYVPDPEYSLDWGCRVRRLEPPRLDSPAMYHVIGGWTERLPLWVPISIIAAITAGAWIGSLVRRRDQPGHCVKCGYDRAGIASSSVCPECGVAGSRGT